VFIVVSVYFAIDSVRKLLDTPSHTYEPKVGERERELGQLTYTRQICGDHEITLGAKWNRPKSCFRLQDYED